MGKTNSSATHICGAILYWRASRCFSRVTCAVTKSFPKSLPKLLLHFTILFSLAGFTPSVYAGNYVPGSCQYGTNTPQQFCELFMGPGSKVDLTATNATTILFDCSMPGCPYPNVDLSPSNGSCWSYNQRGWVASCGIVACPDHASGTPCACDTGYKLDAAGTSCVPDCPIDPLPDLPKDDLCAQSLDKGKGEDVNKACPDLTPEMKKQANCLADKIGKLALPVPYTGPSATIRNTAYQKHLLDVWNKSIEIEGSELSVAEKQACATLIADVERHHVKYEPSNKGDEAPHVKGNAIDIPDDVAFNAMVRVATTPAVPLFPGCLSCTIATPTGDLGDYVNSATKNPPPCNLKWGGKSKTRFDPIHFQLP